jgi:hypothetical protein
MDRRAALIFLATAASFGQQPAVIVKHPALPAAAVPVVGYVADSGTIQIRPILGTASKARLGDPLSGPTESSCLYLPPRQQYALVEANSDQPMAVWNLLETVRSGTQPRGVPITGAMAHADLVAFSPRGDAALLYSKDSGRLQIIGDLPAKPTVLHELPVAGLGDLSQLALSDDGKALAAQLGDNRIMYSSQDGHWQPLSGQYSPAAWSFVPYAHDLVIADSIQGVIAIYREFDGSPHLFSVQGLRADHLSFTKDGSQLLAGWSSDGSLWSWQLASGVIASLPTSGRLATLSCLRDGWTFLLSASPNLSLVKVTSPSPTSAAAVSGLQAAAGLLQ